MRQSILYQHFDMGASNLLYLIGMLFLFNTIPTLDALPCRHTATCVEKLWVGSECVDGTCTNPFQKGCLHSALGSEGGYPNMRVCNSEDPEDAIGVICSPQDPNFDYMEIRIMSQNWESAFFEAWILQIILSEILGIPTTIETGSPDVDVNFYNPKNSFQYGKTNLWDGLRESVRNDGDCTKVDKSKEGYTPCGHVVPEVWQGSRYQQLRSYQAEGFIDPPEGMGSIGQLIWFVPKFVVDLDPTVVHFNGLSGHDKRRKLAKLFKRPTSWIDYCTEVSFNNCSKSDGVAERAPRTEREKTRYFVPGLYTGHFRITPEGDCKLNPENCTGHIADFPCEWQSHLEQQSYHNKIPLKSNGPQPESRGYYYSQLTEIWAAANATRSPVMMYWWTPDLLYQKYLGTEAEFTKVALPPPTQECLESRVSNTDRCPCINADFNSSFEREQCTYEYQPKTKYGTATGACMDEAQTLQKVISSILQDKTFEADDVTRSPAYDVIKSFSISELQIAKMLDYWHKRQIDEWGFDPREAVCRWSVENLEDLKSFVPRSFPRVIVHQNSYQRPIFYVALTMGTIAFLMVVSSTFYIYANRHRTVLRYAQVEFLFILLSGLTLVSLGSIFLALEPTNMTCMSVVWLLTLGYTLELIPLIVKVAAMNRLMAAARRFKRVRLKNKNLFGTVIVFACIVMIFLLSWSTFDPPHKSTQLVLTKDKDSSSDSTIVNSYYYCQSTMQVWRVISAVWHCIMLICATVLAYQTRNFRQVFNESHVLAVMIYSHFVFVMLRLITFVLENVTALESVLAGYRSLIYSVDTIMTIMIYFLPKFAASDENLSGGRVQDTWLGKQMVQTANLAAGPFGRRLLSSSSDHSHWSSYDQMYSQSELYSRRFSGAPGEKMDAIDEDGDESVDRFDLSLHNDDEDCEATGTESNSNFGVMNDSSMNFLSQGDNLEENEPTNRSEEEESCSKCGAYKRHWRNEVFKCDDDSSE